MNKPREDLTTEITGLVKDNFIKFDDQQKALQVVRAFALEFEPIIIEEINMGVRRLSGKWEAQTEEWIEGNRKAFNDVIGYIEALAKAK